MCLRVVRPMNRSKIHLTHIFRITPGETVAYSSDFSRNLPAENMNRLSPIGKLHYYNFRSLAGRLPNLDIKLRATRGVRVCET